MSCFRHEPAYVGDPRGICHGTAACEKSGKKFRLRNGAVSEIV